MIDNHSELSASGFNFTETETYKAAKLIAFNARQLLGDGKINSKLWSYREYNCEHLSCELFTMDSDARCSITLCARKENDFEIWDELDVVDMAEALHLISIALASLDASLSFGNLNNETNIEILSRPLINPETNGKIDLT